MDDLEAVTWARGISQLVPCAFDVEKIVAPVEVGRVGAGGQRDLQPLLAFVTQGSLHRFDPLRIFGSCLLVA